MHIRSFPGCCPRPDWWDDVEIDRRISTPDEFNAVWRDQGLTDHQRAKAMFRAIEEFHKTDADIAAPAITYFYSVGRPYAQMRELYEYGISQYLDFDRSEKYFNDNWPMTYPSGQCPCCVTSSRSAPTR
jgi:hypothetical protein